MMFDQPGVGLQIVGEVYEIGDAGLANLDDIESLGAPGNFRILVLLEPLQDGAPCVAFAYVKSVDLAVPIHTPYLSEYEDDRFVPPWRR